MSPATARVHLCVVLRRNKLPARGWMLFANIEKEGHLLLSPFHNHDEAYVTLLRSKVDSLERSNRDGSKDG